MPNRKSNTKGKSKQDQQRQASWDECNSFDRFDGSKNIGYHSWEYQNSQYGSYPMHDDYSEESFPGGSLYEDEL